MFRDDVARKIRDDMVARDEVSCSRLGDPRVYFRDQILEIIHNRFFSASSPASVTRCGAKNTFMR